MTASKAKAGSKEDDGAEVDAQVAVCAISMRLHHVAQAFSAMRMTSVMLSFMFVTLVKLDYHFAAFVIHPSARDATP